MLTRRPSSIRLININSPSTEEDHTPCIIPDDNDSGNEMITPKKLEMSNSRDFASSRGMIARITMGGILLINTVMNSHSLHDSIGRYDANIDGILPTRGESNNIDDDDNVRRRRKLDGSNYNNNIKINSELDSLDQTLLTFLSESSVGRQKVIEFMIDQYVSPTTPDDNMTDKLDNAMEAMSFMETDAEPVQVLGYPFLFVGSVGELTHDYYLMGGKLFVMTNRCSSLNAKAHHSITSPCTRWVSRT